MNTNKTGDLIIKSKKIK